MPTHDTSFVLWGRHPAYANDCTFGLTEGTLQHCRAEQRYRAADTRWLFGIYRKGSEPTGLNLLTRKPPHE